MGGYSLDDAGDRPEAGTGLRVLDLVAGTAAPRYVTVGLEPLRSPTWVVRHPDQPWLVSVSEVSPSELVCSRLEDDGRLTVLGRRSTTGDSGCHLALTPDGRQVVVAHYGSGTVESFALDEDGQLSGPLGQFVSAAPPGPDRERQSAPHAHQVVLDPHRPRELLVCDLGTDRVHRLRLEVDGALREATTAVVLPAGFGPRHLVVADDTLVVAGELSAELWVGRRERDGWRQTQVVPTSTRTRDATASSETPAPSGLRVDGDRLVVATRGVDTVSVFAVDRARSTVVPVAEVSCEGRHPRDLVLTGDLLWVANQESDEVVALDLATVVPGTPATVVQRLPVPRPACVVLVDARSAIRGTTGERR